MASVIVIRNPNVSRSTIVGFGTFWCVGLLAFVVGLAIVGSPTVIVPIVILAFGVVLMYRMWRLAVVAHDDQLVIFNYSRTYRLPRSEIEAFRRGVEQFERAGYVHLVDGKTLRLDVTRQPLIFRRDPTVIDEQLDQLREWLATSDAGPRLART
jgi:hypothetical protein